MKKVKVRLQPIVSRINMPTVIKTTIFPGDSIESIIVATQVGEIFYIRHGVIGTFADIRSRVLKLGGSSGGYDERGLLGLAFHPQFYYNGLFYLHYSAAGTQGPTAFSEAFKPNPCDPGTLNLKWTNREKQYDHIDTVEEWILPANGQPHRRRTLLNLRRPFLNHNGVNSLNFSPETGKLVLTTGDGGSAYDPFNLSQNMMELAGKIIEIDVGMNTSADNPSVVTRFHELSVPIQETLTVIARGVRNTTGISYQKFTNQYVKYVGNVGQDLVESVFSFVHYKPIPVTQVVQASKTGLELAQEELINLGWRGWEGALPTSVPRECSANSMLNKNYMAYYDEALQTSVLRLQPLTSYYHKDPRPGKFGGTALTGVQPYSGNGIPDLTGSVVFTDLARKQANSPVRGVLAYTRIKTECKPNDYTIIETDYDFGSQAAYYVGLGTNLSQSRLYLGVYGSMKVADSNLGTVFEIVPWVQ
ncbi:Glucose / Sorbosone dehydrogenase [Paenibacillus sp. UNCCL117]|uniref:PQQ-dependent sugar dehydrogenase n=1 Tax=unclassified Paenibacillus TaxID=185978 RepID=UPI000888B2CD|nr:MULTISPECIES: PQQ-dependent sugar dehydrogenase [unclassified Paenibacillus]SDC12200.1 Glucose / Sorbosone dehydrogenase [Paenibacillus sp. cl123]SFW16767.1 Glucose / Sorbosone dehydrogenase [Paenibacillus sp. UNCCL117]